MATSERIRYGWRFQDLIEQRFGKLLVVRLVARKPRIQWECRCDCGGTIIVRTERLTATNGPRSCHCDRPVKNVVPVPRHGHARPGQVTVEFRAWQRMIDRCCNASSKDFKNYGARGIGVCEEWRYSFTAFLEHIGPRPSSKHSVDRFPDNNGNYEPGNVRWATKSQTGSKQTHDQDGDMRRADKTSHRMVR